MNCHESRELFSLYIDGELAAQEKTALEEHLRHCRSCCLQLEEWRTISSALRETPLPSHQAPDGFSSRVMECIRQQEKPARRSLYHHVWYRMAVGIAAALLLVLASSVMMPAQMGKMADTLMTAIQGEQNPDVPAGPVQPLIADKNGGEKEPSSPSPDATGMIEETEGTEGTDAQPAAEAEIDETPPPDQARMAEKDSGTSEKPVTIAALPDDYETPREFLQKERVVTNTLLIIKTAEPHAAQDRANTAAANSGASIQYLGQQAGNQQTYLASKITVPAAQAGSLLNQLVSLGSEVERKVEKKDLTSIFTETLEQYRALINQRNQSTDAAQRAQLDLQIKELENKLLAWDREADHATIVLWLQR